jgi:hypothetical protein
MDSRRGLAIAAICLGTGACSTLTVPSYQSSIDNVRALQDLGGVKASVGTVKLNEANAAALNDLTMRGRTVHSPSNESYADYLKDALRKDLTTAGKYDQNAARSISATLMRNSLDGGVDVGEAELTARFSVTEGAKVIYDKEQTAKHQWESSFIGGIAFPRALQNYPAAVQKLLGRLFADPDFKGALSK